MIHFYYHGGSGNHGCEALVRATNKVLGLPATLFSSSPNEDISYGLGELVEVREDIAQLVRKRTVEYLRCAIDHKLHKDDYLFVKTSHKKMLSQIKVGDICLSIGGDNYCYGPEGNKILGYYNRMLKEKGAKTVLWGCSVEPDALTESVVNDMRRYDLITARESFTYAALQNAGLQNIRLVPDAAFQLDFVPVPFPAELQIGNTVGINLSPLATGLSKSLTENYIHLVRYILDETDMDILLLPHVVKEGTDDRETLLLLQEAFSGESRIAMAEDCSCTELKGLISQCRFFVGARTHATIAAYSTCVPTLVSGYSIKARGIARDLFGSEENYVVPVQSLTSPEELTNAFRWLQDHEDQVKAHLQEYIPAYCDRVFDGAKAIRELIANDY